MKVIITGSTGMVGKGVLLECLDHPQVTEVLAVNRRSLAIKHSKLKEVILDDFSHFDRIEDAFAGYDACFHNMGVSSLGKNEAEFSFLTYTYTESLVKAITNVNNEIVFNYVSGTGTDSTEHGRVMWARVKGKTENMILKSGFKDAYMFRPGIIIPEKGIKSRTNWYQAFYVVMKPFFPLLKRMKYITTTSKIGQAMINSVLVPIDKKHLENIDINSLAEKG